MKLEQAKTVEWYTPWPFVRRLEGMFGEFDLDPCAITGHGKALVTYTPEIDGLAQSWYGTVFMNPPYGRSISGWLEKAIFEVKEKTPER